MGKLIGDAVTLDGDTIRVIFEGEDVTDGTLAHIVSINTQMDGGGEYSPLKQTTASISCLVDGAELMRLCVSEKPVSVLIENVEQLSILFKGYVVPNSYNQALSGINDTITIECVDCLGWAKYVNYERGETFSVMTLATLFSNIAAALGINDVRFPDDAGLVDAEGNSTARYDLLTVSDNMFYKSINPEDIDGELLFEPVAMTCDEVLRMIAESLRLTWVQVGRVFYLIDEVKIVDSTDIALYRNSEGDIFDYGNGVVRSISEESFAASASCNVSSLPRYSRVAINHTEGSGRAIQPALFEHGYLLQNGEVDEKRLESEIVLSQTLTSRIYEVMNDAILVGYKKYEPKIFLQRETFNESWDTCLRILPGNSDEELPVIRCSKPFCGAIVSKAGYGFKVEIEFEISATDTEKWPHNTEDFSLFSAFSLELKSTKTNGSARYYNAATFKWQDEQICNRLYFADNNLYYYVDSIFGLKWRNEVPTSWGGDGGGTIEATLFINGSKTDCKAVYVKKFDVVESVYQRWLREYPNPSSRQETKGMWTSGKMQEVTLPIDNYYYMSDKAFGNFIADNIYKDIIIGGDSMIDRVWKQANLGDRLMWEITLRDEANAITALDAFTCAQLWSGRKVVAGYTRDVLNNTITLTLI